MSKNSGMNPDIRKGMDIAKNIKDVKKRLKDDADRRKINAFNPGDLGRRK